MSDGKKKQKKIVSAKTLRLWYLGGVCVPRDIFHLGSFLSLSPFIPASPPPLLPPLKTNVQRMAHHCTLLYPIHSSFSRHHTTQEKYTGQEEGGSMSAAGVAHSLSLLEDGSVIGWGASDHKQTVLQSPSLPLFNGRKAVTISAGYFHSLALLNDGSVVGWGYQNDEQCTPPRGVVPPGAYIVDISAGGRHSMALLNTGEVVAWGCNDQKQVTVPKFDAPRYAIGISAGCYHSLALLDDGTVKGWGGNPRMGPGRPPQFGNRKTVAMTAGRAHSLALLADGGVVGWGDNSHGQALPPSFRSMGKTVVKLAAGGQHSLALLKDGTVVSWGGNSTQYTPPQGELKATAIDAGGHHSTALLCDGSTVCWGGNSSSQSYSPSFRYRKAVMV